MVGQIRVEEAEGGVYEVGSRMQVVEYREGDGQRVFAGKCRHTLRREGEALKIVLKRVDLVNCDAPHTFITVPL